MSSSQLKVIPLGGLGEIGLNLMVIEYGQDIILVDCGVLFPDLYWLGLDVVIPDFTYLIENADRIRGLVITHGHEDHIGAIPFLLKQIKIPIVYCSRFAARLLADKCAEHFVKEKFLYHEVHAGDSHRLGCFDVEFIHVTHSTLETFALAIKTPVGLIIHSGDFKFDETPYDGPPSDKKRLGEFAKEKPLLLLSDSTNSERCGHSESESSINDELHQLVKEAKGAAIVALFASNIHRVHQLMDIAQKLGRKVFLSGRSMERYVQIAIEENFLPVNKSLLYPLEEISRFHRKEILVLSTGSQGEARSSLLRLAKNENRFIKIQPEDVVILSSRNIPGNERAISYVINQLARLGAIVHYDDMQNVHVSGHAYQEEQVELINLVKPRFFIPVHGEFRHLRFHAATAMRTGLVEEAFVIENGQVWQFDKSEDEALVLAEPVPVGRNWMFGDELGAMDDVRIKERRTAAKGGVVLVDCLVTKRATQLAKEPEVLLKGFLCTESIAAQITREISKTCTSAFEDWTATNPDNLTREQAVAIAAKRVVKRALDTRPLVIVNFHT